MNPLSRKPSETGTIRKDWRGKISVALAYPNTYHVGMSNLGFHAIYKIINSYDDFVCERFFSHGVSEAAQKIQSIESGRQLRDFDIVAFSVSFENDYLNILEILDKSGIPLLAEERDEKYPLVIGGGVACFLNPEPIAPFFDVFLIGEAENHLPAFLQMFSPSSDRQSFLEKIIAELPGIYVPSYYNVRYGPDKKISEIQITGQAPEKVTRIYTANLSDFDTSSAITTSDTTFGDTFLTEISRGCPHGCRFCSAGYVYRPPRFRDPASIYKSIQKGAEANSRIGLIGAAITDHPQISEICRMAESSGMEISFSSLRADGISENLLETIARSGIRSMTIAPDAGSERLRKVINKKLGEDAIIHAAETAVSAGLQNVKLYYMIGLPTETQADIEEIVALTLKVKSAFLEKSRIRGRMGEMTVGVSSFVPKPATPFQWEAMQEMSALKKKIAFIHKALGRVPNITVHADPPKWSYLQGVFARGDRRVSELLVSALRNKGNWPKTFRASCIDPDFFALRKKDPDEILPWDFIENRVPKKFLWDDYQKALKEKESPQCPMSEGCVRCGVCLPDRVLKQESVEDKNGK